MDTPFLQQCLGRQMNIVHAQCFRSHDQAFAYVISPTEEAETDARPGMLVEQHTRFKVAVLTDQHRRASSVCQGVCRDEVFRVCGEIVFLTTLPAKLENLCKVRMELSIADNHVRSSRALDKHRAGPRIGQCNSAMQL